MTAGSSHPSAESVHNAIPDKLMYFLYSTIYCMYELLRSKQSMQEQANTQQIKTGMSTPYITAHGEIPESLNDHAKQRCT